MNVAVKEIRPGVRQQARKAKTSKAIKTVAKKTPIGKTVLAIVTLIFIAISLTDLAHGFELLTHMPVWQCWLLAIGLDLFYCGVEMHLLTQEKPSAEVTYTAAALMGVTVSMSSLLNGLAFASAADIPMLAGVAGGAIPFLIFGATYLITHK
jgi:hypothetical protein